MDVLPVADRPSRRETCHDVADGGEAEVGEGRHGEVGMSGPREPQRDRPEVRIPIVDLDDHRDRFHPIPAALDPKIRRLGPVRPDESAGNRAGVVQRAEEQLGVRRPVGDGYDIGVEPQPNGEERVVRLTFHTYRGDAGRRGQLGLCSAERRRGLGRVGRYAVDAGQDVGGAGGHDSKRSRRAHEAVGDVVHDTVATHRRDDVDAIGRRSGCTAARRRGVFRPLGRYVERGGELGDDATKPGTGETGCGGIGNEREASHALQRLPGCVPANSVVPPAARYAGMVHYRDRNEAGKRLIDPLREAGAGEDNTPVAVRGVARGGVVVAAPIATAFGVPLGVVLARKLRAPLNPELAIGAVGRSGEAYVDRSLVERLGVTSAYLDEETDRQRGVIRERLKRYPAERVIPEPHDIIVVDDGVATGATLIAALRSVRAEGAGRLFCAVPVGPPDALRRLAIEADVVVCPVRPRMFAAVGQWYGDFTQTTDDEVMALLGPRPA